MPVPICFHYSDTQLNSDNGKLIDWFIYLCPCQNDDGYMDGRSRIKVHTDERTQVHSAHSSMEVTHPITNRARRYLTPVIKSPSKHWSPPRTYGNLK